jgi:CheY-like chemotaxis protein
VVAGYHVLDILTKPVSGPNLLQALERARIGPHASRYVLVIDDDPRDLKLAERILADAGYRTACHTSGEEALHAIGAEPPALVVLDLLMPGLSGLEVLGRLRAAVNGQRIPVIIWTGKDLSREEHGRLVAEAQGVVRKNEGTVHLIEEIRALVPLVAPTPGGHRGG